MNKRIKTNSDETEFEQLENEAEEVAERLKKRNLKGRVMAIGYS